MAFVDIPLYLELPATSRFCPGLGQSTAHGFRLARSDLLPRRAANAR
jgi:hypothetical protein